MTSKMCRFRHHVKRICPLIFGVSFILFIVLPCQGQYTQTQEQIPEYKSFPDMTEALQRRIDEQSGVLDLSDRDFYRITSPLVVDLETHGPIKISSSRNATIIMDGPGPAIKIVGTHEGTASPKTVKPKTWNERMPTITSLEVLGAHEDAVGIELFQTFGVRVTGVSVRWCHHGILLSERNRNVIISECHLYENSGVGLYLDDVNLHQINVLGSHISYNRGGGVVVRGGNVRNLQISGCDIEGNMPADETPTQTANVHVDLSEFESDASRSVAEIAITGCTIQHAANYSGSEDKTVAPGGANIRLTGTSVQPIDSVSITANVLSDTSTNIDMSHVMDVAINANNFFAPKPAHLTVSHATQINVSGNTFNPRQFARPGTIRFSDTHDSVFSSCTLHALQTSEGSVILERCTGLTVNALNFSDCGSGFRLADCSDITILGCRMSRLKDPALAFLADSGCERLLILGNNFEATIGNNDTAR